MERCFSELAVLDLGAVAFELLAYRKGLGTCPEAASLRYLWIFQEILGIPEGKRVMLVVPIGYLVQDAPVNRWQRTRISTDEVLKWVGIMP
jgi:nitroreductase